MTVKPAATVVLLQDDPADGIPPSVFFVRRHRKSAFMPNAYVFPGGRVDDADAHPALLERLRGVDEADLDHRMAGLDDRALEAAHVVAAIRETFEEAGVLLATRGGKPVPSTEEDPELWERLDDWRNRLNAHQADFADFVQQEDLALDASRLAYFAHWVTPTHERKRYDTRFFVAAAPFGQRYQHDDKEVTDSCWLTASEALTTYHGGNDFFLAPPTWSVLRDIRVFDGLDEVLSWARAIDPVVTIQPEMKVVSGGITLDLPQQQKIVLEEGHWALKSR